MKATTASKINVLNNYKDTTPVQTVEEAAEQKNAVKNKLDAIMLSGFYAPDYKRSTDFVDERDFNIFFDELSKDLEAVSLSLGLIEQKLSGSKDTIRQGYTNVQGELNSLTSKVNSLAIYNNAAFSNISSITETFSSESDIIQQDQGLSVNRFEEKLTLKYNSVAPVDLSKTSVTLNQQNGTVVNSELKNIVDGNDNTYFEYKQSNTVDKLVLDYTVALSSTEIINQIGINPNNLQTQNWLKVADIRTSLDGVTFTSIFSSDAFYRKYLFQNASQDSGDILNPEKNNNNSYFTYDFHPIRAKFVRFVIEQNSLHPLTDDFRIALNGIRIARVSYLAQGSVIIKKPIDLKTITGLALHVRQQSAIDSPLLKVQYQLSFDNQSWMDIQPVSSSGSLPEMLVFNSPWIPESIDLSNTDSGYVYLKINMSKELTPEVIQSVVSSYAIQTQEYFDFPQNSPYSFNLSKPAMNNDVSLYAMPYIGIGKKGYDRLLLDTTKKDKYFYRYTLPFKPHGLAKFYLGSVELDEYSDLNQMFDSNVLGFHFKTDENTVYIAIPRPLAEADGKASDPLVSAAAATPRKQAAGNEQGAEEEISIKMNPLYIKSSSRVLSLNNYSDGIKANFTIYRINGDNYGNPKISDVYDIIPAGSTRIKLSAIPLQNQIIEIEGCHRVKYIDGVSEFIDQSEFAYSIDFDTQVLYLKNSFQTASRSIHYKHEEKYLLSPDDFILRDMKTVEIREWVFDPKMSYRIEYNMSIPLPKSSYTVSGQAVKLTDQEIISLISGKSTYSNKKLQAVYSYQEVLADVVTEIAEFLTPIINDITITYSR